MSAAVDGAPPPTAGSAEATVGKERVPSVFTTKAADVAEPW